MTLSIKDPKAVAAIESLALLKGASLDDAVREACERELERLQHKATFMERIKPIQDEFAKYPRTGEKADKAFYDSLNDE